MQKKKKNLNFRRDEIISVLAFSGVEVLLYVPECSHLYFPPQKQIALIIKVFLP